MKKQSQYSKTNYHNVYDDNKPTHERYAEAIKKASGDCWWIEQWCTASLYYYGKKKNR